MDRQAQVDVVRHFVLGFGTPCQDRVTKLTGAITAVCATLDGTVQALIEVKEAGEIHRNWLDSDRVEAVTPKDSVT